jgi:hypothetical protein
MEDISAYGIGVRVVASNTFPAGFDVTQFADDADPFDFPDIKIADKKMGVNGDLVVWSVASPIEFTLSVVPGGTDDQNLAILLEANRVGAGKLSAQDVIQVTGTYPQDGKPIILTNGKLTDGPVASSASSAGRLKSKVYKFAFENRAGSPA